MFIHLLMLSPFLPKEALSTCSPPPSWDSPSFSMELTLSSPCSCSDPLLLCQGATLGHLDSLPFHDLVIWIDGKGGSSVLANGLRCGTMVTLLS